MWIRVVAALNLSAFLMIFISKSWVCNIFLPYQDGYVPYHSARIELCPAASSDNSRKGQVFTEMLNNCLDQMRAPTSETRIFIRCDVNFDQSAQGRNLNTMIGRAAHIEFLETDIYAKFIMWSFPELFRWLGFPLCTSGPYQTNSALLTKQERLP